MALLSSNVIYKAAYGGLHFAFIPLIGGLYPVFKGVLKRVPFRVNPHYTN
jgi:hypothetical protein